LALQEEELIIQLKSGKETAFEKLVNDYGDKLFNTCLSILQNNEDAEDITQEVFVEVHQSIKGFKG
jgi:DNA-directed RNA polymerase specialized sigma24 family protein